MGCARSILGKHFEPIPQPSQEGAARPDSATGRVTRKRGYEVSPFCRQAMTSETPGSGEAWII